MIAQVHASEEHPRGEDQVTTWDRRDMGFLECQERQLLSVILKEWPAAVKLQKINIAVQRYACRFQPVGTSCQLVSSSRLVEPEAHRLAACGYGLGNENLPTEAATQGCRRPRSGRCEASQGSRRRRASGGLERYSCPGHPEVSRPRPPPKRDSREATQGSRTPSSHASLNRNRNTTFPLSRLFRSPLPSRGDNVPSIMGLPTGDG